MYGNLFEEIKSLSDIIKVAKFYGLNLNKNFTCKCCFHNEKTASLSFSPKKQIFVCFGCGAKGDIISFVQKIEKCKPYEALIKINDICGCGVNLKIDKSKPKFEREKEYAKYRHEIEVKKKNEEKMKKYYNISYSKFCEYYKFWRNLYIDSKNFLLDNECLPKIYKNYYFFENIVDTYIRSSSEEIYSNREYYDKYLSGGII